MEIGDTITVSYEESRTMRKQGWKPRTDIVVMMYVGQPEDGKKKASEAAKKVWKERRERGLWNKRQHAFVARKLAEAAL
jgi:hypothetical protein